MTSIDVRDLTNHINHFGASAVVQKMGRKWWVKFRDFGPPSPFKTKRVAVEWAAAWPAALRLSQQTGAIA